MCAAVFIKFEATVYIYSAPDSQRQQLIMQSAPGTDSGSSLQMLSVGEEVIMRAFHWWDFNEISIVIM